MLKPLACVEKSRNVPSLHFLTQRFNLTLILLIKVDVLLFVEESWMKENAYDTREDFQIVLKSVDI